MFAHGGDGWAMCQDRLRHQCAVALKTRGMGGNALHHKDIGNHRPCFCLSSTASDAMAGIGHRICFRVTPGEMFLCILETKHQAEDIYNWQLFESVVCWHRSSTWMEIILVFVCPRNFSCPSGWPRYRSQEGRRSLFFDLLERRHLSTPKVGGLASPEGCGLRSIELIHTVSIETQHLQFAASLLEKQLLGYRCFVINPGARQRRAALHVLSFREFRAASRVMAGSCIIDPMLSLWYERDQTGS